MGYTLKYVNDDPLAITRNTADAMSCPNAYPAAGIVCVPSAPIR